MEGAPVNVVVINGVVVAEVNSHLTKPFKMQEMLGTGTRDPLDPSL